MHQICKSTSQLDSCGATADDGNGHKAGALSLIRSDFRTFEIGENGAADILCICEGLESKAMMRPLIIAEVARAGTGSKEEIVIGIDCARGAKRLVFLWSDTGDFIHQDGNVFCSCEDLANRAGNIWCSKRGGSDLIEQRLEKMVVGAIYQRDFEVAIVRKLTGAFEACKAAADDEKFQGVCHGEILGSCTI